MIEIIKGIVYFIIDIMQKGFYVLPFLFTIFIIDYLKKFYSILWINETTQSLVTLILNFIFNFLFVFINMMIIVSIFKTRFNGWVYVLNSLGNFAISCGTVDLIDVLQKFITDFFSRKKD